VKICLCGNRFPPNVVGGAEVIVHDLAVQLRDRGHEVSILTLSDTRSGARSVVDGLDVRIMPNMNVYNQFVQDDRGPLKKALFAVIDTFNPVVFLLAWRQLKSLGVDVLCTNNLKGMGPAVWLAARALRVPIVHVMHDYWLACPNITRFKNGRACVGFCKSCRQASVPKAWLSRLVGHAVAVSKFVLERHRDQAFFPRAEQSVIYNARPPMVTMQFHRNQPSKPHTPFRVGFIGRTDATKGIREFFASVAAAAEITTAIEVHIAGRDIDNVLPELIAAHPQLKVVYHGFMAAAAFYETVDLIAVTSMWDEPFGMVAIEPWEFYKPSIAFASGGLAEVFAALPDLSVPRGDCVALGTLIGRLACDEAFYLDAARRCHAERANFMPAQQVDQFERVLLAATGRDGSMKTSRPTQADRDA
jgi:glycosyltransferase involved in cell wall biosynthesis